MNLQPTATTALNLPVGSHTHVNRSVRSAHSLGRSKIATKRWQQQYNDACFRELHRSSSGEFESPVLGGGAWVVVQPDFLSAASSPLLVVDDDSPPISSIIIPRASRIRRGGLRARSKIATKRWQSRYDEEATHNSSPSHSPPNKQKKIVATTTGGPLSSSPSSFCTLIDKPRLKRASRR